MQTERSQLEDGQEQQLLSGTLDECKNKQLMRKQKLDKLARIWTSPESYNSQEGPKHW